MGSIAEAAVAENTEFRIREISTNIDFVENLLKHPTFIIILFHEVYRQLSQVLIL